MLIYEVNLKIQKAVYYDYYDWLIPHTKQVLQCTGFLSAEILREEHSEKEKSLEFVFLTVCYRVADPESLQTYLKNHAQQMREEAKVRFGDSFTAHRRVFSVLQEID